MPVLASRSGCKSFELIFDMNGERLNRRDGRIKGSRKGF